jgi:hypothetical protein
MFSRFTPALAGAVLAVSMAAPAVAGAQPYLMRFPTISTVASAVPTSGPTAGDVNPYGVAVVPQTTGDLVQGDVLVSNFNDAANHQGTGASIVEISPAGMQHVFAVLPPAPGSRVTGLTTALAVLPDGFVVVGALPAPDGNSARMTAGALFVLDAGGSVVETITGHGINGPWDMTAVLRHHDAVLFVTNVLNGTVAAAGHTIHDGSVVRLVLGLRGARPPVLLGSRVVADGFAEHTDPNALVVGPTGVDLSRDGTLYVADSVNDRIAAVPNALTRTRPAGGGAMTLSSGGALNDPLGLTMVPGGDIVTMNGNDGDAVETTPAGRQVAVRELIGNGAGDLFGVAVAPHQEGLYFVNDSGSGPGANSLGRLH